WDVHHGNGTQHLFESDPSVYYFSLHQWPLYPGTGRAEERGVGEAHGTNLNCLMEPGDGDDAYFRALEEQVIPKLQRFSPQCIIISAGFDAHDADPLSATRVTASGFRRMTRLRLQGAPPAAAGRCLALLEGGYDLKALADSLEGHLGEMVEAAGPAAGAGS
ncbi:MAG: histone deacetylase, partial [Acidobacteriota bacterium]